LSGEKENEIQMILKNVLKIFIILSLISFFPACQSIQEKSDDLEQITSGENPINNPTQKEIEAVKDPCADAQTQEEAEKCAKDELAKVETELNQLVTKITGDLQKGADIAKDKDKALVEDYKKDIANLNAAQKAWSAYREANCLAEKDSYSGGSLAAVVTISCQERMTEQRIDELKAIYEK
jgi:uncharacterized protein YecT (DUF1311 family)